MPGTRVTCCDGNAKYASSFARLAEATGNRDVTFTPCLLQNLPLESHSLDAIYCISVLEHTGRYGSILEDDATGRRIFAHDHLANPRRRVAPERALYSFLCASLKHNGGAGAVTSGEAGRSRVPPMTRKSETPPEKSSPEGLIHAASTIDLPQRDHGEIRSGEASQTDQFMQTQSQTLMSR